jgi:hypothetical protein
LDMEFAAVAMSEERKSLAAYEIKIHRELTALKEAQKKKLDESKAERIRSDERLARALAIASISSAPVSQLRSSVSIGKISRRYPTYYPVYRKTRYRNVYYYGNYWNAAPRCNQLNFYKGVQQPPVKPISPPPPCGNHKH